MSRTRSGTIKRRRASRRKAASQYRRMRGGAALVAEMIRDIKEDVEDDIDKSRLEKAVDTIEAAGSDTKRTKTGETMFMTSMRRIKASSTKEMAETDKRVEKILNGHVRDILPAFDRLVKESADCFEKKIAGMNKMKAALERIKQSQSNTMDNLQKKMDSVKAEMESGIAENNKNRNKIVAAISGINGGDKIKNAFQNISGGGNGILGTIGGFGFFDWLWGTLKYLLSTIVSILYFIMALLCTISLVLLAIVPIVIILSIVDLILNPDNPNSHNPLASHPHK